LMRTTDIFGLRSIYDANDEVHLQRQLVVGRGLGNG
jgi:hypothetical protein